jgi:hypothetical protein
MADPSDDDFGLDINVDSDFDRGDGEGHDLEARRREERRAVEEAGGGEAEGFELAEQELIEHASHGDQHNTTRIMRDASEEAEADGAAYGEADGEHLAD